VFKKTFCVVNKVASLDLYTAHDIKNVQHHHFCPEINSKMEMTDMKRYINQIKIMTSKAKQ